MVSTEAHLLRGAAPRRHLQAAQAVHAVAGPALAMPGWDKDEASALLRTHNSAESKHQAVIGWEKDQGAAAGAVSRTAAGAVQNGDKIGDAVTSEHLAAGERAAGTGTLGAEVPKDGKAHAGLHSSAAHAAAVQHHLEAGDVPFHRSDAVVFIDRAVETRTHASVGDSPGMDGWQHNGWDERASVHEPHQPYLLHPVQVGKPRNCIPTPSYAYLP